MSGGGVYQEALRKVMQVGLPEVAQRDVLLALEAALPGPLALLETAGREAGLPRDELLSRAAGLFFSFSAGNLADDVSDGDCTLWPEPARVAPYVQFLLQNLAWATLARTGLPLEVLAEGASALAAAAGPQGLEVRTRQWTAPLYREVAEGIAGRQWAAYLRLLLAGSPHAEGAADQGLRLGMAAHVAEDIRTGDSRFHSLSPAEQAEVVAWALGLVETLAESPQGWLGRMLPPVLAVLREPSPPPASPQEVSAYYAEKTEGILARYGPGPRVHFHTGFVEAPGAMALEPADTLRARVQEAQERLLVEAAALLAQQGHGLGRLLDVGCGLGGGTLFWAERGAHVTALTPVEAHARHVERFAAEAGVGGRVRVQVGDALEVAGEGVFDTVVAVESVCYLPREAWMRRVVRLLRPGGRLLVADCFLRREALRAPFDRHWRTRIGTLEEYEAAAEAAGLVRESRLERSAAAAHFWEVTLAGLEHERREAVGPRRESVRTSRREHRRLRDGLRDGGFSYALLVWRRP